MVNQIQKLQLNTFDSTHYDPWGSITLQNYSFSDESPAKGKKVYFFRFSSEYVQVLKKQENLEQSLTIQAKFQYQDEFHYCAMEYALEPSVFQTQYLIYLKNNTAGQPKLQFQGDSVLYAKIRLCHQQQNAKIIIENLNYEQFVIVNTENKEITLFGPHTIINDYLLQAKYTIASAELVDDTKVYMQVCVNFKESIYCYNKQLFEK